MRVKTLFVPILVQEVTQTVFNLPDLVCDLPAEDRIQSSQARRCCWQFVADLAIVIEVSHAFLRRFNAQYVENFIVFNVLPFPIASMDCAKLQCPQC
jgi:hypothetical protein